MPHPRDLDLVRRVLAADRAAFDRLYERVFPCVLAYAQRRLGPGVHALGTTEDSLEELIHALPQYDGGHSLDAFALEIVRRLATNATARSARALALSASATRLGDPSDGAQI